MNLTAKQKATYIENRGMVCPHCESHDFEKLTVADIDTYYSDAMMLNHKCKCADCGSEWIERYKIEDVI